MNFPMVVAILLFFSIADLPLTSLDLSDYIKITDIATAHIGQLTRYRLYMSKVANIYKIGTVYDWLLLSFPFEISHTNLTHSRLIFSFCTPDALSLFIFSGSIEWESSPEIGLG